MDRWADVRPDRETALPQVRARHSYHAARPERRRGFPRSCRKIPSIRGLCFTDLGFGIETVIVRGLIRTRIAITVVALQPAEPCHVVRIVEVEAIFAALLAPLAPQFLTPFADTVVAPRLNRDHLAGVRINQHPIAIAVVKHLRVAELRQFQRLVRCGG